MFDIKQLISPVILAATGQSVLINVSLVGSVKDGVTITVHNPKTAGLIFKAVAELAKATHCKIKLGTAPNTVWIDGGYITVISAEKDDKGYFDHRMAIQFRAEYTEVEST